MAQQLMSDKERSTRAQSGGARECMHGSCMKPPQKQSNSCCGRTLVQYGPGCKQARGKRGATAEQRAPARLVCIRYWLQGGVSLARPCPLCTCVQRCRHKL